MNEGSELDPEVAGLLRQGAGRELREEAAEDEQLTELLRRRRLDLSQRLLEVVHRGERVRAETGTQTFSGQVIYAGSDFATVDRGDDAVDVVLDAAVWAIEPSHAGGREQSGNPLSFRARLAEVSATGSSVRTMVEDGRAIVGPIGVVATDHIEIDQDGSPIVVPLAKIIAVVRSSPGS